jgi:hypothetical protein
MAKHRLRRGAFAARDLDGRQVQHHPGNTRMLLAKQGPCDSDRLLE